MKPTKTQFNTYQALYDYFNKKLFSGKLPACLLNLSRKGRRVCGHFSPMQWEHREGGVTHEININPLHLASASDMVVCQTLVHEMVHLWQHEFGNPSRAGYHNKEWGNKMEEIGLMPSNTGKPGGKKTGQQMDDYPIEGGTFLKAFKALPEGRLLPYKSVENIISVTGLAGGNATGASDGEGDEPEKPKKNKVKYTCPCCKTNIWGKPGVQVICLPCISEHIGKTEEGKKLIELLTPLSLQEQ